MKTIIFDTGSLISFAMNGMLPQLIKLKSVFDGKFIITEQVRKEVIDTPLSIKRFEFEGMQIRKLLQDGVLEMPDAFEIKNSEIQSATFEFVEVANNLFTGKGRAIHLIDDGEASCLALSKILSEKKIKNVICVDERTIRVLGEKPENLRKLLQKKMHTKIDFHKKRFDFFEGFKFIRSSELAYVAYKKGFFEVKDKKLLEAVLYALMFKGCSISEEEIQKVVRMG